MASRVLILACIAFLPATCVAEQREVASSSVNPIRKVVSMLQMMQKKVTEEGEREKDLYEKFMCYCKNSGGTLGDSISASETKIPAVSSDIEAAEADKTQTEAGLKKAQADRASAIAAMEEATAIREKEAAVFTADDSQYKSWITALDRAIAALEKGMAGAFLQTSGAEVLKQLVQSKQDMFASESDREQILAFLSQSQPSWSHAYGPKSGQITGILKELRDEMAKTLGETQATEAAAIQTWKELMTAKTKEKAALIASVETKIKKIGELAVSIVNMKNDLSETEAALMEDKKFRADLEKGCATKTADWEERSKTRSEELVALAETIKLLNDDDALDLFKSTLPSPGSSFVQVSKSARAMQTKALAMLRAIRDPSNRARLDLLALALAGKKASTTGFEKVIGMIDAMIKMLKEEQVDDDNKKEYCLKQFDFTDDKKKDLERYLSQTNMAIASAEEGIATLKDEIAALVAGIASLDKAVADATVQRKAENKEFTEMIASDTAATDLLKMAKNRLNKFYNAKLYKAAPKVELTAEERILVSQGGTAPPTPAPGGIANTGIPTVFAQISAHVHGLVAPPPPPETYGAYGKKSEQSTGVIAMIDILIADLAKEMAEGTTAEKDAQADYEAMMKDSSEKRVSDSKAIAEKGAAKAAMEEDILAYKEQKGATTKELAATVEYIASLHSECDWLLQYFDVRKEARTGEVDSLVNAKAVLSGSDYSLLQFPKTFLGRKQ